MRALATILIAAAAALPLYFVFAEDSEEGAPAPVGQRCRECHMDPAVGNQWGALEEGPHARAFDALGSAAAKEIAARIGMSADPRVAADCLACHAPDAGARDLGVSCEACHGDGHDYAGVCGESFPSAVSKGLRLSGERDCIECHRKTAAHPDMDFLFVLDMRKIAHPRPAPDPEAVLFSTEGLYRNWEVFTESDGLPHHMVFGVTTHGDDVWFATEDGVARLRDGKFEAWRVEDGLPHQAATQVAVDAVTGEVWVSTLAGIASFDGSVWTAYTQENSGLINNCAFGIALFEEDVWVATFDGISRYDRESKEWKKYYLDNAPLEEVWIYGVEASFGQVNFAVWGGGLVEYVPDRDYWNAHHDPDGSFELNLMMGDGVISQMTTSVSRDNGWTWIASYFGMCGYSGRDWIEMDMDDSGLPSNFINFVKARRSQGWFATDRGISCFDLARDRWVNYRRLDGPGDYGEITITSRDGGKRRSVVTETCFPFNFVWGIAFSGEDIWVATSDGVARGRY